jgi:GAF domain-containing protein
MGGQEWETLIVNTPEKDPRFYRGVDERTEFRTRNIMCVPVKVKDKVIGVLEAVNKKHKEKFDREDLSLFVSLADQVAIALDNARLYEELEEMFSRLQSHWLMLLRSGIPIPGVIPRGSLLTVWRLPITSS